MAVDNKQIALDVLQAVGGKDNITIVQHCMTRLRFTLKDRAIVDDEVVKNIKGVMGVQKTGTQYQVIVGQNVEKVYNILCEEGGLAKMDAIDENLDPDAPKEKLTLKSAGGMIFDYLSGSMVRLIPLLMASGLCKAVASVIGPELLGLVTEEDNLYILFDFVYDAGFYFMPIFLGYSAAKKLGCSEVLGLLMGAVLIAPDFVALAGNSFSVFGIPTTALDYSQSVLPILLCMPVLAQIEKFLKKHMPDTLTTIFTPFLTILIMLPIAFCALAPLGNYCGNGVNAFIQLVNDVAGPVAVMLVGGSWEFLVMTGMHVAVIQVALISYFQNGYMTGAMLGGSVATVAVWGTCLGAFLRLKDKEEKSLTLGYFISGVIGGVTEPALYGLCFKFKRCFLGVIAGGAVGGLWLGLTGVCTYTSGASNFLGIVCFAGGTSANLICGVASWAITFVVATVVTYLFGFSKEELEVKKA